MSFHITEPMEVDTEMAKSVTPEPGKETGKTIDENTKMEIDATVKTPPDGGSSNTSPGHSILCGRFPVMRPPKRESPAISRTNKANGVPARHEKSRASTSGRVTKSKAPKPRPTPLKEQVELAQKRIEDQLAQLSNVKATVPPSLASSEQFLASVVTVSEAEQADEERVKRRLEMTLTLTRLLQEMHKTVASSEAWIMAELQKRAQRRQKSLAFTESSEDSSPAKEEGKGKQLTAVDQASRPLDTDFVDAIKKLTLGDPAATKELLDIMNKVGQMKVEDNDEEEEQQ